MAKTVTMDYQEFKDMEYELELLRNIMDMEETEQGSKEMKKITLKKEYIKSILKDYGLTYSKDIKIILE